MLLTFFRTYQQWILGAATASASVLFFLALPRSVLAQTSTGGGRGFFIAGITIGILALVFFTATIWAAVQYRRFPPDDARAVRARMLLLVFGGVAILCTILAIVFLILGRTRSRGGSGGGTIGGGTQPPPPPSLRTRVIERHTPRRDEQNVPRNTSIVITFRDAIESTSILDTKGTADPTDDLVIASAMRVEPQNGGTPAILRGHFSRDGRTLSAQPLQPLGDVQVSLAYRVRLTASIRKKSGESLFPNQGSYEWVFTTGRTLDTTPPTILSVRPVPQGTSAPNSAVQVVFSEPIDASVLDLTASGSRGLVVLQNMTPVPGSWQLNSDGTIAEFLPIETCGKNTCGQEIRCLPRGVTLTIVATPGTLGTNPPGARLPYDGIVDQVGNSLDGNSNGKAEGRLDVFRSPFTTLSAMDTTPPVILEVRPTGASTNVDQKAPIEILFSKPMLTTSITNDTVSIEGIEDPLTYRFVDVQGRTRVVIDHPPFTSDQLVAPIVSGALQDMTQNCYQPCTGP